MKPRWMRRNWACPDCGCVFPFFEVGDHRHGVDCERCGAHFATDDFMDENCDKWDKTAFLEEELVEQEDKLDRLMLEKDNDAEEAEK